MIGTCRRILGDPIEAQDAAQDAFTQAYQALATFRGDGAFGAGVGVLRMAAGAHFFSDAAFAGVFTFLVIWVMHGAIYRWRRTSITDEAVERAIARLRGQ